MQWDMGLQGIGTLLAMSLGFGVAAWLLLRRLAPRWVPPAAAAVFFALGVVISEVWFGWATEEELQPNIDGLSFDEVMLGGLLSVVLLVVLRVVFKRHMRAQRRSP